MRNKAGYPHEHIVIDNGSTDGTLEWLNDNDYLVLKLDRNYGILSAMQIAIDYIIKNYDPDYIIKFDNDCEIQCENILATIMDFYKECESYIVAPIDTAILERQRPKCFYEGIEHKYQVRKTTHVGGIFKVMPVKAAKMLLDCSDSKVGGDLLRGRMWIDKGYEPVYLMDHPIEHKGIGSQTKHYKLA